MIAYKVMRKIKGRLHSLAHNHHTFSSEIGTAISMSGRGVWLSTNKQFVLSYYSGNHDDEVLLQVMYSHHDITSGNDVDNENVFTVPRCAIINVLEIGE